MSDDYSADRFTTGAVAVGGSTTGTIETAYDEDWFAVELVAGRTYQFDLEGSPTGRGTLPDTYLRAIYDSEGRYQSRTYNDNFDGSRNSRVTFTAEESGTYYVRASGDRDEVGDYTLSVRDMTPPEAVNPPPADPPPDTAAVAAESETDQDQGVPASVSEGATDLPNDASTPGRVAVGDTATGTIGTAREEDWFAVELVAGRTYVIDLRGNPTDDGTLSDPYLRGIHDAGGNRIANTTNDDGGQGYNSRVTFTATESSTHYIAAGAWSSRQGTYEVEVTDTSPPIVGPDQDSGDPPDGQEQVQQQVQQQPPAFGSQFYGFELEENADGSVARLSLGTVSATDPDGGSVSYGIEGGNESGRFEIDAASGELFYVGGGEDYETGSTSFELTVRASDGDQTTDATVTVDVTDAAEAPAFAQAGYAFDLAENADGSANRLSLGTVSAADPDGGSVSYGIEGGNESGRFEIDAASGELFYVGAGEDYETGSTRFELTVRASDGDETTDTNVTVNVTDVDEPVVVDPPVTQPDQSTPQTVSEPAGEDFSRAPSTSGRVAVGDTATGSIGSNGDRDWFAVELVAGRTYVIDLRGSPTDDGTLSDPYLRGIYDADGNRISNTTNDDGGQGYNSRLTFTATESGTHYIAAGAWSSRRGTYEVEVTDTSPPETDGSTTNPVIPEPQEPTVEFVGPDQDAQQQPETSEAQGEQESASEGDTDLPTDTTTPGRVVVGGSAMGAIGTVGDQDWFAVELEAGKTYRFDLKGSPTSNGTLADPYLRGIHDADGEPIANTTNNNSGSGWNSRVYFTADEEGTHYVAAGAFDGYMGTYTLSVTEIPDDYAAEPDPDTTGTVAVGGSVEGDIEAPGDQDWFAVELEAGKTYRVDLKGAATGGGTLTAPYLNGIHDADGNRIANTTDNNSGTGSNSRVYFTPTEDGTYYVAADGYRIKQGTYTLSVTDVTDDYVDYAAEPDPDTTGIVTVGGSATGEIHYDGDEDWFAVELEAGVTYRFDLKGSRTDDGTLEDPYLRGIHHAGGERIANTSDDDGGEHTNSRVGYTPDEEGTYYVAAGAYTSRTGTYTLSVINVSDDYPADPATTGTVAVGGSARGTIEAPGDRDWFAVELEAGTTYQFDLEGRRTGDNTLGNPYLRGIHDAGGERIANTTNNDGGEGDNSRVYFTPDEEGTYYVAAGADGNEVGTYTLSVTEITDDYAAEPDPATTGSVAVGGSARGNIDYSGDEDWFAVELEAGRLYQVDLKGAWWLYGHEEPSDDTLFDPYLRGIHDADGDRIAGTSDDNSGQGLNSQLIFTPDEAATYYVAAGADGNEVGTYTLSVTEVTDDYAAEPNPDTTGAVAVGGSVEGTIDYSGDEDWFAVELEAGTTYRFDLKGQYTGSGTLHDPGLHGIHDADGDRIANTTDDDGGFGTNSRVTFTPTEDGTYYVAAGHVQIYIGTYTLSVEEVDGM